jgi:A118 family predicted phage portal protein
MSLPAAGTPWPPPPHQIALAQQAIWDAWLVGDREGLAAVYGDASPALAQTGLSSREGGILPKLARFFWGKPSVSGQRRYKLHVPLAADIATASADLLFSEPPQFIVGDGKDKKAQARVDECLNQGNFHSQLLEAAEITAGLGGGWLRLVWDTEKRDYVMIDTVPADAGLGEWWMGELQAVTFFTELDVDHEKNQVLRHLERHEKDGILHGLYKGTKETLGDPVDLAEHPSTAPYLAGLKIETAGGVKQVVIDPQVKKKLTAAYVANMRPQKRWRKIEGLGELGRSDYAGVEPFMDALDEVYTAWMREIRLAKARLIVPEAFLEDLGKGKGAAFDEDQEVFTGLNIMPNQEKTLQITPQQFEIRVTEYKQTADQYIDHVLESAGYSPSTFGRGGEGEKTATEVVSRERQSARTRDKKTRYWSKAFGILDAWAELDSLVFGKGAKGPITTQWPDASQPDQEALARTAQAMRTAEAASTVTLVRMLHPDWTEKQVKQETKEIRAESGRSVPDLGALPGEEDEGDETE